jgi:NhaA family Na+:H+ antiporter
MFIANLAFADVSMLMDSAKIGILTGSLVSGVTGYMVLRYCRRGNSQIPQK